MLNDDAPGRRGLFRSGVSRSSAASVAAACAWALALAACGGAPDARPADRRTIPLAGKVLPPPAGAYLGVFVPDAPFDAAALDGFERQAGKPASIVMWYQPWSPKNRNLFDAAACADMWRRGKVPLITWEPWDPGNVPNKLRDPAEQPSYRLSNITAGRFDGYIRTWARGIKAAGGPVMLRPFHEMNGNWYPWAGTVNGNDPVQFSAAWRHVHDIFEKEGATNVTWVWSVNQISIPNTPANRFAAYYPGDAYVDWVGASGFNWGAAVPGGSWTPWETRFGESVPYLETLGKPIIIDEMASVEQGGSKAAWIREAYDRIRQHPKVKAVVYFDDVEHQQGLTQDWRVNSSPASLAAFRAAVSPSYWVSTPPAALADWTGSLSDSDLRRLKSFRPIY